MKKLKNWVKKRKITVIILLIIIIGGGYYWYQKAHANSGQVKYITTAAQKGTLITSVSGSGNVIVDQSATVDPTITGTVANLAVNIGDQVKKGQKLFTIVNDQLGVAADQAQASYVQAQGSLESSQASVTSAKAAYKADKKSTTSSHEQKLADEAKINVAEDSVGAAQQSLIASQSNLANVQKTSSERNVVSPIDGTVNAVNVKNGDDLSRISGSSSNAVAPIIIGDLSTMKAQVQVNEVDVPNVSIGEKATMTFGAIDGLTATGKVEKMDSLGTVSQGVVTYNVTIGFDTLDPRIKPGMSVSASIVTKVEQDVITVPNGAVKSDSIGSYVQVLNSGTTPQAQSVEVGDSNNTDTIITSGVNVGDNVVTQTIKPNTTTATTTTSSSSSSSRGGGGGFGGLRGL